MCWIDYRACRKGKQEGEERKEKKNSPGRSCCRCNYSTSVESGAGRITTVKVRLPGSPGEESQMSPFSTTGCQAARRTAAVTGRFEHAFLIVVYNANWWRSHDKSNRAHLKVTTVIEQSASHVAAMKTPNYS